MLRIKIICWSSRSNTLKTLPADLIRVSGGVWGRFVWLTGSQHFPKEAAQDRWSVNVHAMDDEWARKAKHPKTPLK